jgi:hypothetical protein
MGPDDILDVSDNSIFLSTNWEHLNILTYLLSSSSTLDNLTNRLRL